MCRKVVFFLCFLLLQSASAAERVLYEKNSLYQYIVVSEDSREGIRYVHNNEQNLPQGGMRISAPDQLAFEYYRMSLTGLIFLDTEPMDILVIGLGAGAIPRYLNRYYPNAAIDIVEIDPEMLQVAQTYFFFRENAMMRVHINDGRIFVKRAKKKYDLVLLDAYRNGSIPFHLTTKEFLSEVKKILKPNGVVVSNILSERMNQFHDSMIVTYQDAFQHLYLFNGKESGNYAFIATEQKRGKGYRDVLEKAKRITAGKRWDVDLSLIAEECSCRYPSKEIQADILTDDFAPVDILRNRRSKSQ